MSETVLVTGAFGLVGSAMVKRLAADGRQVIASGRNTPANRKAAQKLPAGVDVRWADLTDSTDIDRLVSDVTPTAIIHLAAVIPPGIYRDAAFGRKVNVHGTALWRTPPSHCRIRPDLCMRPAPRSMARPIRIGSPAFVVPTHQPSLVTCMADTSSKPRKRSGHRAWTG